jgi:hypothetical protein
MRLGELSENSSCITKIIMKLAIKFANEELYSIGLSFIDNILNGYRQRAKVVDYNQLICRHNENAYMQKKASRVTGVSEKLPLGNRTGISCPIP